MYYRKSRCISRVFETTNHANLLDLDLYTEPRSIRSITKKYKMLCLILGGHSSYITNLGEVAPDISDFTLSLVNFSGRPKSVDHNEH